MAYFGGDNEFYQLTEQVKICQTQQRPDTKLEICLVICQMLNTETMDEAMANENKKMDKYARDLLTNPEFRRKIHKRQALMEREPITYFGQDTPKGDEFDFDESLEKEVTQIQFRVTTFLANVMAFIQEQQAI